MYLNKKSDCCFEINDSIVCFIPDVKNMNKYDYLTEFGWIGTFPRNTEPWEDVDLFMSFGDNEEESKSYFNQNSIKLSYEER